MSKERLPKALSHSAAAAGGLAVGYLLQRRKLNQVHQDKQAAEFRALRMHGAIEQAQVDDVTGLQRREALANDYEKLVAASHQRKRSGEQFDDPKANKHSLLLLDLDHFKKVNDQQGHNKGDEVLGMVASIVIDRVRERDLVVRWGGEEIAVLLPRATEDDAIDIAEDLRESIADAGQVTASFGVTEINLDSSLKDNFESVDQALYAAKEAGRNRVVPYSSLAVSAA
jgi:diguanylate cyclase (GGDEF) domain